MQLLYIHRLFLLPDGRIGKWYDSGNQAGCVGLVGAGASVGFSAGVSVGFSAGASVGFWEGLSAGFLKPQMTPLAEVSVMSPPMIWFL